MTVAREYVLRPIVALVDQGFVIEKCAPTP
jgi:hypothetical protein